MEETAADVKRILVVDDDTRLQDAVQDFLRSNGYEPRALLGGKAVIEAMELHRPDIVLLDVMMPGEDGFSVLRRIRTVSQVPVIMLTARGEDTDRIIGLEMGADDYLPKPFNPRELLARIKAVLRRSLPESVPGDAPEKGEADAAVDFLGGLYSSEPVRQGSFVLDRKRQTLSRKKQTESLSTVEFRILYAFMTNPGKVFEREHLKSLSPGRDAGAGARNIDVHISHLRSILRQLGEDGTRIRTVWGTGYCWIGDE